MVEQSGQSGDRGMVKPADHAEAARLAGAAGRMLVELRRGIGTELSPEQGRHEGDRRSHEFLSRAITELFPHDGLLSEEGADSAVRLGRRRVWVVDPLDGTREFGEPERTDWAVHVALAVDGRAVVGAVALPARDIVLSTELPPAAPVPLDGPLRVLVSRTRPPASAQRLADLLEGVTVPMGSAGAKAMAVVLGDADVYFHAGGQYEWDSAAPVAVAASAGLHVSRVDGSALRYNQPNPWLPDVLVCRADIADDVLAALQSCI
jgi:3'(2'), 5'-bisphosphate nucleotidase